MKNYRRQSGAVVIIGLIILLILTLLMLTSVRVSILQERMAANMRNQNIAFQAAESALREAESFIESGALAFDPLQLSNGPFQNTSKPICVDGLCGLTSPLQSSDIANAAGKKTATTGITTITAEPQYLIELIRVDPSTDSGRVYATFRITARAWGGDSHRSLVQLQSTYRLHALSFIL